MDKRRSQRAFVGVTLTTVLSIAFVLIVYAALLGKINSTGYVNVGGIGGAVYYSLTNTSNDPDWSNSLGSIDPISSTDSWYAKMNTTANGYIGQATILWELKKSTDGGSTWSTAIGETVSFTYSLNGAVQTIYATSDGTFGVGNRDWHSNTGYTTGLWKVEVTISTTT